VPNLREESNSERQILNEEFGTAEFTLSEGKFISGQAFV
jgi:hypothetical protein